MSAKVSSASSASAAANIVGGKAAAPSGPATGSAGTEATSGAGAARSSSGSGSGARFSSAMTHAAHAGDSAKDSRVHDGNRREPDAPTDGSDSIAAGADAGTPAGAAADVASGANPAAITNAQDLSANASPVLSQNAANLKSSALGPMDNARGGRSAIRIRGGESAAGSDPAAKLATDPVALAMLLVASGMQMSNTAPSSATNSGSAPANAGDGAAAAIAVSSAAADGSAGLGASGPVSARDAPHSILDAASSSTTAGAAFPDLSASLASKSANSDSPSAPTSLMTGSAGLPELVRSFAANSAQAPVVEATISAPVASGSWPHAVAAQVHWFVTNDVQSATLRLSPEHLGPVEVQIDVRDSQVNVNFSAAHAETRAALEQTVPRLREIFASGGLTLGHTNVQQDPRAGSRSTPVPLPAAFAHAQTVEPVAVAAAHSLGLVDEYA